MMHACIFYFIYLFFSRTHEASNSRISCKKNKIRTGSLISISKGELDYTCVSGKGKMMIFFFFYSPPPYGIKDAP